MKPSDISLNIFIIDDIGDFLGNQPIETEVGKYA